MEYKLVVCKNDFTLEKDVNELLKEGWKLQGGVCISYFRKRRHYSQAMVKE